MNTFFKRYISQFNARRFGLLALIIGVSAIFLPFKASAATPAETLEACVKKLSGAKSMKASFTATFNGRNVSGTLLTKGKKFSMTMPGLGTWYDGKSIWSYSSANGETTVWTPTAAELAESNPLLYLSSASDYNVKAGTGAKKGESVIVLTPKKRNSGVKSITAVINNATSLPKRLTIVAGSASSTVTLTSLTLNTTIADSQFAYPKSKYPKATVTDLR